ncbi:protein COFACTOR ASSEMBLY OF COMPLEX C SUBUNIT B CCB4, chloroplastic isoform X2 [Panicum miliaceum]|uniref:Protein COFACTOR ASSEMBLY OF COMPLEX C SUBUNIT B CCB4, chloroplastic isoform X2 n=1 Tax=Panicum miliaceum TaxID=4540 RepID=A0A3L6Q6L1_PANMI|nr:protein COFACTOR ASSEMBLY OF COMPLEX C SUBUNIT B CCB4, chloroplastic isoform X2 [Panicum miliaceum]
MELGRGIVSAPLPQPALRTARAPRLGRRLPFGAFSPPLPLSNVREHGCCNSRAGWVEGWVRSNDTLVRSLPILVGGASLVAVLLNRAVSGIAAVADASRWFLKVSNANELVLMCQVLLFTNYFGNCSIKFHGNLLAESYLANLALYPGRSELPFLPANTQALILQPIGDKGIAIVGGDTIRGFTSIDQAWIAMIADKLDATLSKS